MTRFQKGQAADGDFRWQQQLAQVAIARALANDPPIIIADEPTGNLDSRIADAIFTLFEQLVDGGKTIPMVTHDDDLAQRVSQHRRLPTA
ncbi:MAG: hypothetical protein R2867_45360 [Caldilineaceae bacterium]